MSSRTFDRYFKMKACKSNLPLLSNQLMFPKVKATMFVVCLFVWVISSHSRIFHSYGDVRYHYCWRAANFDQCSALMTIEQWGFFDVPHLLWHGASVYYGYLRGPVTLISFADRLKVELSLPVFRLWFEHPTFRLRVELRFHSLNCIQPHLT